MAMLGWVGIVRLGLVQAAIGAVVVIATSTLNRVMVVELALPALLPGLLVGLHYAVQISRPRVGHGSDQGGRRTPWIVAGVAVLGLGTTLAALAVPLIPQQPLAGLVLAVIGFMAIGLGVGAGGTALLTLLAQRVAPERRAAAAATTWLMMIAGFAVTATLAGRALDPYTPARLAAVSATVGLAATLLAALALAGLEGRGLRPTPAARPIPLPFRTALAQVLAEPAARRFTVFVFVSMLAYSAQDLILEPYAGLVHGYSPGQSTSLAGLQHGGTLVGMLLAGAMVRRSGALRAWTIGGCLLSAAALAALALGGLAEPRWPLPPVVFALGAANGAFSIAAIATMMQLAAGDAGAGREGLRIGLWGAAQAIAFCLGGLLGTGASDLARLLLGHPAAAYGTVFLLEAALFLAAAFLAGRLGHAPGGTRATASATPGEAAPLHVPDLSDPPAFWPRRASP